MERKLFEVILFRDDKRINTTKARSHKLPYIPGSYQNLLESNFRNKFFEELHDFFDFYIQVKLYC